MVIYAFITHKRAEHFTDCQDRFSINSDTKSVALSDGMSQSIFQKYWAQILTQKFTSTPDWVPNLESVRELSPDWKQLVLDNIKKQKEEGNPSAWRAERSIIDGRSAGATFLGIRFKEYEWECNVLGDSCLVVINKNKIEKIVTSEDVTSFNNYPDYYDSNPINKGRGVLHSEKGTLNDGDILLLVSDPFSDFLLKNKGTEQEGVLVDRLHNIRTHQEYEKLVEDWRKTGMHNDDSTLIIIKQDSKSSFNIATEDKIDNLIKEENKGVTSLENPINENIAAGTDNNHLYIEKSTGSTEKSITKNNLNEQDLKNSLGNDFKDELIRFLSQNLNLNKRHKKFLSDKFYIIKTIIINHLKK